MKWKHILTPALLLVADVSAIFTDDAFHIDYHKALLGVPLSHTTFFHKPQSSSNASLLYTISDKAILGAVNPRDGSLVWRQALAGQPVEHTAESFLVAGDTDGRVTSGFRSSVQAWDALDGRLVWAHTFESDAVVRDVQIVPTLEQGAENIVQDIVAIAGPGKSGQGATVVRLAGDGSAPRWQYQDRSAGSDTLLSITTSPKYLYYISRSAGILSGGKAKVVVIDITTGKETSQYSVSVGSEVLGPASSQSFGSGGEAPFMLSTDQPYKSFKFNLLGNTKTTTVTLEDHGKEIEQLTVHYTSSPGSAPHFLVHARGEESDWAEVYRINAKSGDVTRTYGLPDIIDTNTFAATAVGPAVYFARITRREISLYSSESPDHVGTWPRSHLDARLPGRSLHAAIEVSTRGTAGVALRAALSSSLAGWTLMRNGEQSWIRPEYLAYVDMAIWADDLQVTALEQEIEAEATSNPMTAYIHRLTRHLQDLKHLPQYLLSLPESLVRPGNDTEKTTRQKLIGSKLIIAATAHGEVMALEATNLASMQWVRTLWKDESSPARATHLSVDGNRLTVYRTNGEFVVLDTTCGEILERQKGIKASGKIVELPGRPASTVVEIPVSGRPKVFSDLAPAVPTEGNVLVTINDAGEAIGWSVGTSVEQVWTIKPENGAKFTDIVARPDHDPIASIGTVLGDRSVLYKYINPNVALLTAMSSTALTMYIVNAVTGAILYTTIHEGVLGDLPISAVATGNKFVYSFTIRDPVTQGLSSQIVASDLYESDVANDRGMLSARSNYSSYSPDAGVKPYVQSIAFTVAEPLSNLTVTQTIQGITSRQFVAYLVNSRALVGIPSEALNARRPVGRDATSDELEEGLMKYAPVLDLDPRFFLSHSQEVLGIEQILTAPTVLESTSLVFAFGHDVFGTQLAPSNAFDVLGKGFKRIQLVLTIVALYFGVILLRPVARKKIVERNWS